MKKYSFKQWFIIALVFLLAQPTQLIQAIAMSEEDQNIQLQLFEQGRVEEVEPIEEVVVEIKEIQEDLPIEVEEEVEATSVTSETETIETDTSLGLQDDNAPPAEESSVESNQLDLVEEATSEVEELTTVEESTEVEESSEVEETVVIEETTEISDGSLSQDLESLIPVIVELNAKSALERANFNDEADYRKAVQEAQLEVSQLIAQVQEYMGEHGYTFSADLDYSGAFTGFSSSLTPNAIEVLKQMQTVKSVTQQLGYKVEPTKPTMIHSDELTGLNKLIADNLAYRGENIIVSVIDTGIDPEHRDLQLDDSISMRYTQEEMEAKILELGLPGQWYSNKIPYGFNYADQNFVIKDRHEHGLHVAGTIGANGDLENDGIQGIAPYAQLLAMKVFSNDNLDTVFTDIYLKAIDDSIKLGADIINMSLGGMSGFSLEDQAPLKQMLAKAKEHGIIVAIAAGNDRNATWIGQDPDYNNLATNPDSGLVGDPANHEDSFAVGSFDNTHFMSKYVEVQEESGQYQIIGTNPEPDVFDTTHFDVVYKNKGLVDDYSENEDLTGKYVIVQRGDSSFDEKYQLAIAKGAEGVIIYDNISQEYPMNMIGINVHDEKPVMFIRLEDGQSIVDKIINGFNPQVIIPDGFRGFESPRGGQLSEFSSWGPTSDLRLKPEISAPGGNIWSLMSDDRYQDMSGTSMATPHIAGLSALLLQHLYEEGTLVRGEDGSPDPRATDLVKLILMNTAVPAINTEVEGASYYGPSQQGAGLANIYAAILNKVLVTATNSVDTLADGKLEIGEVQDQFDIDLTVKNTGDQEAHYIVEYVLTANEVGQDGRYTEATRLQQKTELEEIVVAAGQELTLSYVVDTLGIDPQQLVEGFIFLHSKDEANNPSLSVPILGFKGDWTLPPFLDEMHDFVENPDDQSNFRPIYYPEGGVDKTAFVISNPNGGYDYWRAWKIGEDNVVFTNTWKQLAEDGPNEVVPVLSFLRNAVDVNYLIKDQEGNVIRQLFNDTKVRKAGKLYLDPYNFLYKNDGAAWDYKDMLGNEVEEGIYSYEINGLIDYPGADRQYYNYQIVVDNTMPEVDVIEGESGLSVTATDNLSGILGIEIVHPETGTWLGWNPIDAVNKERTLTGEAEYSYDIFGDLWGDFYILVYDNSGNTVEYNYYRENPNPTEETEELTEEEVSEEVPDEEVTEEITEEVTRDEFDTIVEEISLNEVDPSEYEEQFGILTKELPYIALNNPSYYAASGIDSEGISFDGEVWNFEEIHNINVNLLDNQGNVIIENVPVTLNKVTHEEGTTFAFEGYVDFASQVLDSGQYWMDVTAYTLSSEDNKVKLNIKRQVRVDTERPKLISLEQIPSDREGFVAIEVDYSENMNYIELWANNHMMLREDKTYWQLEPFEVAGKKVFYLPDYIVGSEVEFAAYDDARGNGSTITLLIEELLTEEETTEEKPVDVDPIEETTEETTTENPIEETTEETTTENPIEDSTEEIDGELPEESVSEEISFEEEIEESIDMSQLERYLTELQTKMTQRDQYRVSPNFNENEALALIETVKLALASEHLTSDQVKLLQEQLAKYILMFSPYFESSKPSGTSLNQEGRSPVTSRVGNVQFLKIEFAAIVYQDGQIGYLCMIKEGETNRVLVYTLKDSLEDDIVLETLENLIKEYGKRLSMTIPIIYSIAEEEDTYYILEELLKDEDLREEIELQEEFDEDSIVLQLIESLDLESIEGFEQLTVQVDKYLEPFMLK